MTMSRKVSGAIAFAIAAALALAGCSSEASPPADVPQELRIGVANFPPTLDPHQFTAEGPLHQVFESLVRRTSDGYEPLLAAEWSTPDNLTWVFNLDPAAKFSDGTAVTSTDVKASIERILSLPGSFAPLWGAVASIDDSDPAVLVLKTETPVATLLSSASTLLVGQSSEMNSEDYWRAPIGSGRFLVSEYVPSERLVLEKNEDYWGEVRSLDSITMLSIPELSSRITAIATGEIDIAHEVTSDGLVEIDGTEGVEYLTTPTYRNQLLWLNNSREPFDNALVRQAMWHAIDFESIVADLWGHLGEVAEGPVPQTVIGAPALTPYSYDPELAKKKLAEAGYPDGFSVNLKWSDSGGETQRSFVTTMVSQWAEIGVTVESIPQERSVWPVDLNELNWDMNTLGNTVLTGDADYALGRLYTCAANRLGFCNEDIDELLTKARQTIDQDERDALYQEVGEYMWKEAISIWPIDVQEAVAVSPRVQNFELAMNGRHDYSQIVLGE